jgi:hypothetical protein
MMVALAQTRVKRFYCLTGMLANTRLVKTAAIFAR